MRELVRARHVMPARVTASQTRRVVEVVVLELDEGGLAALGDRRAGRCTVAAVTAGWTGRHRAEARVMKMLLHVGAGASGTGGTAAATATGTTTVGSTTARHTVRGRGTRRTGVARPEWAPQIREIERRRAARTLHLKHDVDAAATAHGPRRRRTRRRRRRRRDRRVPSVRGPNFGNFFMTSTLCVCLVRLCRPSVEISAESRHRIARV